MRKWKYLVLAAACAAVLVSGCGDSKSRYEARDAGITAMEAGDYEGAITAFDQAIGSSKGIVGSFEADVLKYRAEAEYGVKDYAAAAKTYDVLMQIDKERPEYLNFKCIAEAQAGNQAAALADYKRSLELDKEKNAPGRQEALLAAGGAMEAQGESDQAMALYEEAIAAGNAGARLYNRMGLCSMGTGDYEKAKSQLQQGLSAADASQVPELKYNMAVICEAQGEFTAALDWMEQYVADHGPDEEAERELAFLKTR